MEAAIDISVHNGIVNMQKVKDAGYNRVFIRAGYGKNNIDQRYISNAEACNALLLPTGIYWFSYGYNEDMARAEGQYAVAAAKKYWSQCPITFDLEYDTITYARKNGVEINKELATRMAVAFLREVTDAGYLPVLYTNRDYKNNYFDLSRIQSQFQEKVYIWYARYTKELTAAEKSFVDIWQKSSKGKVDGISGNVDLNEVYTTFDHAVQAVKPSLPQTGNLNVKSFQRAANSDGYRDENGAPLAEDGIDGVKTQKVRKKICLQAKKTDSGYTIGSTGNLVTWWQNCLTEIGYPVKADHFFGNATRKQTLAFQKKYQLTADGIAGYQSLTAMIHR